MGSPTLRLLSLSVGTGLLIWICQREVRSEGGVVSAAPALQELVVAPERADYATDYAAFVAALSSYREGEDDALAELRGSAERLDDLHDRADAPIVCSYYASLSSAERVQGAESYQRFLELWSAVQEADIPSWPERRAEHLAELRSFIATTTAKADFVPAGRALSLAAQIEVRALEGGMRVLVREDLSEAAKRDALEAIAIFERAGMETPRLEPLELLAKLARLAGEQQHAEELFEELLDVAEMCRVDDYRERGLLGLAAIARERGDLPQVDRLLDELATFRTPADCWPLAREHAGRLLGDDLPQRAAEFLLRNRPSKDSERQSWTHLLALTRLRQGDVLGARALLDRLDGSGHDEELIAARAQVSLAEGSAQAALDMLGGEVLAHFTPRARQFAHALRGKAQLELGRPVLALEELASARVIAETWEARLEEQRALEGTGATIFGEWLGLDVASIEARALAAAGRELEAALAIERAQSRRWRELPADAVALSNLLQWAARYEHGLVTWIFGADLGLAVYVDRAGGAHALEIDRTREQVKRAVRRFREALLRDDSELAAQLSLELTRALLPAELHARLSSGQPDERLLFIAHGPVELLPFEALEWAGETLDERVTCLVLPGLRDNTPGLVASAQLAWSLLGDPEGCDGRVRLPAAEDELDEVQALWNATRRATRAAFTREALLVALAGGEAVHIATHLTDDARCDTRLFASVGLELSNGEVVCASELAEQEVRAPLIVLSACDTAGGRYVDARGRQGVARALLDGGARDLLITLWPVLDEAARDFTPRFHAALRDGLSPSRAARRARQELAATGTAPADWAAFRIAGRD